jgi:hypothetical protein
MAGVACQDTETRANCLSGLLTLDSEPENGDGQERRLLTITCGGGNAGEIGKGTGYGVNSNPDHWKAEPFEGKLFPLMANCPEKGVATRFQLPPSLVCQSVMWMCGT